MGPARLYAPKRPLSVRRPRPAGASTAWSCFSPDDLECFFGFGGGGSAHAHAGEGVADVDQDGLAVDTDGEVAVVRGAGIVADRGVAVGEHPAAGAVEVSGESAFVHGHPI